jgi:hypothetical protein
MSRNSKTYGQRTDQGHELRYAMLAEFGNPLEKVEEEILKESEPCFGKFNCSYEVDISDTE